MNSCFLYNAWGLYHHKCLREEYKGNTIILHIEKASPEMLSQVRSSPFGEEWFSHSRLYQSSDRWQKGDSAYESPPLQVQVCRL